MLLQLETDSNHVSKCQYLLSNHVSTTRNFADFGLHLELLISGVGRLADILEDVHDFALDVFEVQHLLH